MVKVVKVIEVVKPVKVVKLIIDKVNRQGSFTLSFTDRYLKNSINRELLPLLPPLYRDANRYIQKGRVSQNETEQNRPYRLFVLKSKWKIQKGLFMFNYIGPLRVLVTWLVTSKGKNAMSKLIGNLPKTAPKPSLNLAFRGEN